MIRYAFIDSQNLNLGVRTLGWQLDYRKFRQYLRDKHGVSNAYLFMGYVADNELLYDKLRTFGYTIVFKPTIAQRDGTVKGNVDAELVLHAMIQLRNYSQAVIASGDGDFYCLVEYLESRQKLARLFVPNGAYSRLLGRYRSKITRVDTLRVALEYKK